MLPDEKIKNFLELLLQHVSIDITVLYKLAHTTIYKWLLEQYIQFYSKNNDNSKKPSHKIIGLEGFKEHIVYFNKPITYKIFLLLFHKSVQYNYNEIREYISQYCFNIIRKRKNIVLKSTDGVDKEEICFYIILRNNNIENNIPYILLFLDSVSLEYKKRILYKYLFYWMKIPQLVTIENITILLKSKKSNFRIKLILHIPTEYLKKYRILFQMYHHTEKNDFVKHLLEAKIKEAKDTL